MESLRNFRKDIPKDSEQKLLTALANANSRKTSAKLASISYTKLQDYLSYARTLDDDLNSDDAEEFNRHEQDLLELYRAVLRTEADAESKLVGQVNKAATDDWKAAAHILKYRNREDWGDTPPSSKANPSILDDASSPKAADLTNNPSLDLNRLTVDEVIEFERLLRKAQGLEPSEIENAHEVTNSARQLPDYGFATNEQLATTTDRQPAPVTHSTTSPAKKLNILP